MKKIYLFLLAILSSFLLNSCQQPTKEVNKETILSNIKIMLASDDASTRITSDFTVTLIVFDTYDISWESDNEAISISGNNAIVTRASSDTAVVLTAGFTFNGENCQKLFDLTVLKQDDIGPSTPTIDEVKLSIKITYAQSDSISNVTKNIGLSNFVLGYSIMWSSNNSAIAISANNDSGIVQRQNNDTQVTLIASFVYDDNTITKDFVLMVISKEAEISKNYYQDFSQLINYRNSNYPEPQSEYINDYDITLNNINYDIVNYRSDIGMNSSSQKCITLGGYGNQEGEAGRGLIRGRNITDGINSFTFQARLPFSPESKYPQGNGKDTASNSKITLVIYQSGLLIKKITFQFATNKEANKGHVFSVDNLEISGTYTFELDIDSGHRATIAYIKWDSYKSQ